jgi:hypothetical protein
MRNVAGLRNRITSKGRTYTCNIKTSSSVLNSVAPSPSSFLPSNVCKRRGKHQEECSIPDVIATPPPQPDGPILLLEGDQYHLSENGIARSIYQIPSSSSSSSDNSSSSSIAIEELYDIEHACKSYAFRNMVKEKNDNDDNNNNSLLLGEALRTEPFMLQEIPGNIHSTNIGGSGPGTGSTTWESSIAMSIYFASHPELLFGRCVELGSGVGFGGIATHLLTNGSLSFHSLTLTDHKDQVLQKCKENIRRTVVDVSSIDVAKLDWYDFIRETGNSLNHSGMYNTVIACDCAYLYPDVLALKCAMKGLLKRERSSRCYVFGPSNRGGLQKLISELQRDKSFEINVEEIDLIRYRLDPSTVSNILDQKQNGSHHQPDIFRGHECSFYSRNDSNILLVTCSIRLDNSGPEPNSMSDID